MLTTYLVFHDVGISLKMTVVSQSLIWFHNHYSLQITLFFSVSAFNMVLFFQALQY